MFNLCTTPYIEESIHNGVDGEGSARREKGPGLPVPVWVDKVKAEVQVDSPIRL